MQSTDNFNFLPFCTSFSSSLSREFSSSQLFMDYLTSSCKLDNRLSMIQSQPTEKEVKGLNPQRLHRDTVRVEDQYPILGSLDMEPFWNYIGGGVLQQRAQFSAGGGVDWSMVSSTPVAHTSGLSPWKPHVQQNASFTLPLYEPTHDNFQTCSPWETCPGLAPPDLASFDLPVPGDLEHNNMMHANGMAYPTERGLGSGANEPPPDSLLFMPTDLVPQYPDALCDAHSSRQEFTAADFTLDNTRLQRSQLRNVSAESLPESTSSESSVPPSPFDSPLSTLSSPATDTSPLSSDPASCKDDVHSTHSDCGRGDTPSSAHSPHNHNTKSSKRNVVRINYAERFNDDESDEDYAHADRGMKRPRLDTGDDDSSEDESTNGGSLSSKRRSPSGGALAPPPGKRAGRSSRGGKRKKSKRRFWCPRDGCNTSFTRPTDLERHLGSVHRDQNSDATKCSFCGKNFSREDAVLRHENDSCPARPRGKQAAWE